MKKLAFALAVVLAVLGGVIAVSTIGSPPVFACPRPSCG
jgi:hypothetical protein